MSIKYTRGLDNSTFLNKLDKSNILQTVKADPDLFLCIRNNYVNIYYLGASLAKISYIRNDFHLSIANKYLPSYAPNQKSAYDTSYTEAKLIDDIDKIKGKIYDFQYQIQNGKNEKYEKIIQQKLIQMNNQNQNSNWFCVDMEYNMQRISRDQPNFGRFDIIAITKKKPHKIALIELKYGCGAYSGKCDQLMVIMKNSNIVNKVTYILDPVNKVNAGSGILGHICDYIRYINSGNISTLKSETIQICNNYSNLGMLPQNLNLKNMSIKDFNDKAEVYFITIGEKTTTAKTQMKKYLISKSICKDSSIYNVEDILGVDITKQNNLFNPNFLFCDENIKNLNINNIIDYNKYS